MAETLLLLEPWDGYGGDGTQAARVWGGTIAFTNTPSRVKTGTWAMGGSGSGQATSRALALSSYTKAHFGAWIFWTSGMQPAQGGVLLGFISGTVYDGFNAVCALNINTDGTLRVTRGFNAGTTLGTSTATLTASGLTFVEANFTFGGSGAYEVRLDGVNVLSGSGNMGGTTINGIHVGNSGLDQYALDGLFVFGE